MASKVGWVLVVLAVMAVVYLTVAALGLETP